MEQRQWVVRALAGDRSARAHLFEETIQSVYYLCWKLTGNAAQAGEITRRTYARAFSHLQELREDAAFDRWVTVIAVNLCRQSMKQAQPWLFATDAREMAILRDTYVAEEACLPPECPEDPELRSLALRTLSLLPPEQRVCMTLRYVAHLKPHQIAKTMEVDEVTVLGRLNAGRRALMTALPCPAPQPQVSALFASEAATLPVPELLRGSCMQTVLNAQPEVAVPTQADEPEETPEPTGLTKKQKYILYGGIGVAALLLIIIMAILLRSCGASEPEALPEPEPAPVEEIDKDLEAAALLEEYGIEMLLTCDRRSAEALVESWQSVLPDYISGGAVEDLDLSLQTANDAVNEVRVRLVKSDLELTRLRGLGLGSAPELSAAAEAIASRYRLPCYTLAPLFDPEPRAEHSMAAYSENYRYELLDENGDGRAEVLSITRVGAGFDAAAGVFRPYGESLTDLFGRDRAGVERIFDSGDYEGDGVALYAMRVRGAAADGTELTVSAILQARNDMDAARERLNVIALQGEGCFAELLPELQLPDSALTLRQLERKLQALSGQTGRLEGDVFAPLREATEDTLYYYTKNARYLFYADDSQESVYRVEVLDLSDCKLWNGSGFRLDVDLASALDVESHRAYTDYGLRAYALPDHSASALGLWEQNGVVRTIYNAADPRPLWELKLGDSREHIEARVEKSGGYCCEDSGETVHYVLPEDRELFVTYVGDKAKLLRLESHSHESGYTAPKPLQKSPQELFREFLETQNDVKTSWFGDLTHDGTGDLLVCRASGSGCLVQLYTVRDGEMNPTPIYAQTIATSAATDVYVVAQDSGPCLLYYAQSEAAATRHCSWRLVSINASGAEVVLGQNEASVDLLEMLFGSSEACDAVNAEAEQQCAEGTYLCGTQTGTADFADRKADLSE